MPVISPVSSRSCTAMHWVLRARRAAPRRWGRSRPLSRRSPRSRSSMRSRRASEQRFRLWRPRASDMAELTDLGLVELAEAIRARRTSSREATEAALARAQAVQPALNAFVAIDEAGALAAADAADAMLARGLPVGTLHGVPLAHKDMFFRKGRVSGCGSAILKDVPADRTATVLERLDAAGALEIARLNMAE